MRFRISVIVFLTVILSGLALYVGIKESSTEDAMLQRSLAVQVRSGENMEDVRIWEDSEGKCYVFLPSYAKMEYVYLVPGDTLAVIDDVDISDVISCENIEPDRAYSFTYIWDDETVDTTLTFVQSVNIPSVYIDTHSRSMDYIHEEKGNKEPGSIRIYKNNGELDYKGELESIKGRGNVTWDATKRPYSIKLSFGANLLGMGSAEKWILLAEAYDDSYMRNKIGLDMARKAGMKFTPECQWVDLYLNGEYAGLYLLSERNEVHNQRVDISHSDSFFVSMELKRRMIKQQYPHIITEGGNCFRVHYSSLGAAEIMALWQSAENAILAKDGVDPVSGKHWEELIDVDSWAMRLLVDEIMVNRDAANVSEFFYYDAANDSGLIKAGPVWDLDFSLALGSGFFKEPNVIVAHKEHFILDTDAQLFSALYQKTAFRERLIELYRDIFLPLAQELVDTEIQQYAEYISGSANMDRIRWHKPDPAIETEYIRTYLEQRISFLNEYWLGNTKYNLVHFVQNFLVWKCIAVPSGDTLPNVVDNVEEWFVLGTNEPFDLSQPIHENVILVDGDIDFTTMKEYLDGDVLPDTESNDGELSILKVAPLLVFLVFLTAVFSIEMVRMYAWKRRGDRKSDTYTAK